MTGRVIKNTTVLSHSSYQNTLMIRTSLEIVDIIIFNGHISDSSLFNIATVYVRVKEYKKLVNSMIFVSFVLNLILKSHIMNSFCSSRNPTRSLNLKSTNRVQQIRTTTYRKQIISAVLIYHFAMDTIDFFEFNDLFI